MLSAIRALLYHLNIVPTRHHKYQGLSRDAGVAPSFFDGAGGGLLALPALKLQTAEGEMYVEANNVQAKISLIGWDWGQSILQVRLTGKTTSTHLQVLASMLPGVRVKGRTLRRTFARFF